jgi:hypothetical protein
LIPTICRCGDQADIARASVSFRPSRVSRAVEQEHGRRCRLTARGAESTDGIVQLFRSDAGPITLGDRDAHGRGDPPLLSDDPEEKPIEGLNIPITGSARCGGYWQRRACIGSLGHSLQPPPSMSRHIPWLRSHGTRRDRAGMWILPGSYQVG